MLILTFFHVSHQDSLIRQFAHLRKKSAQCTHSDERNMHMTTTKKGKKSSQTASDDFPSSVLPMGSLLIRSMIWFPKALQTKHNWNQQTNNLHRCNPRHPPGHIFSVSPQFPSLWQGNICLHLHTGKIRKNKFWKNVTIWHVIPSLHRNVQCTTDHHLDDRGKLGFHDCTYTWGWFLIQGVLLLTYCPQSCEKRTTVHRQKWKALYVLSSQVLALHLLPL